MNTRLKQREFFNIKDEEQLIAKTGVLFLCATPIGNLEDITFRALRVLKEVDLVAAEDTRRSRNLFSHFDIHTPLISYHEHNKATRGPEIIKRLSAGESVALISDAGIPAVSDPGADLVKLALLEGIKVTPLPGASAFLSALICSGLDTKTFLFIGFLPKTKGRRKALIKTLVDKPYTLIFYESIHRVADVLAELEELLGNREAAAARELTKRFEEFKYAKLKELADYFKINPPKGELTIIVSGQNINNDEAALKVKPTQLIKEVEALTKSGLTKKEAVKIIAAKHKLPSREIYQLTIKK